jgi:hypothetical protein
LYRRQRGRAGMREIVPRKLRHTVLTATAVARDWNWGRALIQMSSSQRVAPTFPFWQMRPLTSLTQ